MIESVVESSRLEALERYRLLDSKGDATIDALTRLAADLCGTSMALVTLVDHRRQWFLSHVGIEATETPRELSFCAHAIEQPDRLMVVDSPTTDVRFKDNALVTGKPFVRFYAGMPIVSPDGFALGALCVLDNVPHAFTEKHARTLRALAKQVGALLEARRDIRELKGQLDQRSHTRENLGRLRYVDVLTGAPDRAQLMRVIAGAYARLQANPHMRAAVVLVGIDGVNVVDESLGHGVGDALMNAGVERIAHALRTRETVARYGDHQIVVLLEDIENAIEAAHIAKRILALFESSFQIGEHSLRVRANVGMTITDGTHQRGADLVRDAASAMYHARSLGEGTFASFTPALHDMAVKRLRMEGELRRAIDAGEFRLYYQPIVALTSTATVAFEALIRWQHPERGVVMPDEFIGIAEETGLIHPIGDWVLREGCRQMSAWRRQHPGFGNFSLSVNVSARQFNNSRLYEIVRDALDEAQLPPNCLQIELTETALIENNDAAVATLVRLRDLGVAAHLDDFGCGYSSLHYLRKFPVTTLKIDRSFISGSGSGVADPEIVQAVIALAAKLNVDVTAEGIETPEQLDELRTFGCARAQGYYFSKPLHADAVVPFVARQLALEPLGGSNAYASAGLCAATATTRTVTARRSSIALGDVAEGRPVAARNRRSIFDLDRMGGSVVLVISPHPDDDVLGCGGTLSRAASQGCDVWVLYVTDGSASHVRSKRFPPATVARIREREAAKALRSLGIHRPPLFLRAPDGRIATLPESETMRLVATIAGAVRDVRPAVIFSPWSRDPHADHVATAGFVAGALRLVTHPPPVLMYGVWLGILGTDGDWPAEHRVATVEVDLSAHELAMKRKAILEHVSQTTRLIDDDPEGFLIGPELLAKWLLPKERFYRALERRARSIS